jgi:hypothetical protein
VTKIPKLGRVREREPAGKWVIVEWVDDEGYLVIGEFILVGWGQPPRAATERFHQILSNPPQTLYGRPRRARKAQDHGGDGSGAKARSRT